MDGDLGGPAQVLEKDGGGFSHHLLLTSKLSWLPQWLHISSPTHRSLEDKSQGPKRPALNLDCSLVRSKGVARSWITGADVLQRARKLMQPRLPWMRDVDRHKPASLFTA